MRAAKRILLISFCSLLLFREVAHASVLLSSPPPDVQLSFSIDPADIGSLKKILLKFSTDWKFVPYSDVPRAKGKFFFLGLNRSDTFLIVTEVEVVGSAVLIDFYKLDESLPGIQPVEKSLERALKKRWSKLIITIRQPRWNR